MGDMAGLRFDSGDDVSEICVNEFGSDVDNSVVLTLFGQLFSHKFSILMSNSGM